MTDREMLTQLVNAGNRFRSTPFVDDDFPAIRDEADGVLRQASDYLRNSRAPEPPVVRTGQLLTFADFAVANRMRCESAKGFNHALESWSLSDWLIATGGELGEAMNLAKKLNRVRDGIPGNSETPEELHDRFRDEVADTFVYLDLLAQSQGFCLETAVREKFNKTSAKIGYPFTL